MESDTPETDAILKQFEHILPLDSCEITEVARKLERERDKAEDGLREIALFLSCGGYNDDGPMDVDVFVKKIKEAILGEHYE